MKSAQYDAARVQAPLVIGVTGHRDLRPEDIEQLERKVKHIFRRLREQYPFTPFLVLSPLAEGADRLVARVALSSDVGARLVAPLPMPAAQYEEDFQEPGSLDEFRDLLSKADDWFELSRGDGNRDKCYEAVGVFVARHSQLLIALWDGVDTGKRGGTWEVIQLQTQGPPKRGCDLQPPELFPVYHLVTPRRSNPTPAGEPFHLREIHPPVFHRSERAEAYYAKLFHNLDRFNRWIAESGEKFGAESERSKRSVLGTFQEADFSESERLALDRYAVANALAIRFRRLTFRAHLSLHAWVLASFFCFVLFAHLGHFHPGWLILALVFLSVGYWHHRRARSIALDDQSQDYRAVAEGARVRFFWTVAGIDESVQDNYLNTQRTELDWIRNGLRGWAFASPARASAPQPQAREPLEFAFQRWVENQSKYFKEAAEHNVERSERAELFTKICVVLTLVTAGAVGILAIVNRWFEFGWWEPETREWLAWPVTAIELFLALAALAHHFSDRMAYREHAKQYSRMNGVFRNAVGMIREKLAREDYSGARDCLTALGKEALAENGEWVLVHRERPLELPHP